MPEITEKCFFFAEPSSGAQLYGCLYQPVAAAKPTGILIAPPIGRERLRVYRELACTSRVLASKGYPTLRFDYRGEGESEGRFQHGTLSTRADDLVAASEVLRNEGCEAICPLGLREGALVALCALERVAPARLALCEPICSPRQHVRTLIRTNILSHKHYYNEDRSSAEVRRRLAGGKSVSVHGFQLGAGLVEELEHHDPLPALEAYAGQSALFYFAPKQTPVKRPLQRWQTALQAAGRCETICTVLSFSWSTQKKWDARFGAFDDAFAAWLSRTEAT